MFLKLRLIALSILLVCCVPALRAQSYDDELSQGLRARKASHVDDAIQHFRRATEIDPGQVQAHMYLAAAYVEMYIPGVESQENILNADQAIEQYQHVLDMGADGASRAKAAKGIAYLYLNIKNFEEAKTYYLRASEIDPKDPEPYYSVGVISWTQSYSPRMEARTRLNVRPEQQLDPKNPKQKQACDDLRAEYSTIIEEGIASLGHAVELRPDYDDAMAYMNLMYRNRAHLNCEDEAARRQDLATADKWVDRALAVKKAKAEQASRQAGSTEPNPQ
jgi:tetratricopeptide (TPR) repeat protein